jgi:peptide-methionine (S)-S-oxide reductase
MRTASTRIALLLTALAGVAGGSLLLSAQPAPKNPVAQSGLETATFAGGCFWCTESDFDKVNGVKETTSGFMGGHTTNPTYAEVSMGKTGHAESVQVKFDPKVVSYKQLVDYYWRHVDVLDGGGQFCDRGNQYRPVIFVATPEQRKIAEESKAELDKSKRFDKPIAVEIADAGTFTAAEDYHQNYHNLHSIQYNFYRYTCGRDARLKRLWGDEAATAATH